MRAAAAAASHPAWPPPITMTSKRDSMAKSRIARLYRSCEGRSKNRCRDVSRETVAGRALLADTEIAEDHVQNIFDVHPSREPTQGRRGGAEFLSNDIFTTALAFGQ